MTACARITDHTGDQIALLLYAEGIPGERDPVGSIIVKADENAMLVMGALVRNGFEVIDAAGLLSSDEAQQLRELELLARS